MYELKIWLRDTLVNTVKYSKNLKKKMEKKFFLGTNIHQAKFGVISISLYGEASRLKIKQKKFMMKRKESYSSSQVGDLSGATLSALSNIISYVSIVNPL